MGLPTPDFRYNSAKGASCRETRQNLEFLGRTRTPQEEVDYWEATVGELEEEFPALTNELANAKQQLAIAQMAI